MVSDDPDRLGAESLFAEHSRYVARLLCRLGVRADDVDDLVQDVFVIVHRRGGYSPGRARPTTWLGEIAIRVAWNHRKRRARRRRLEGGEPGQRLSTRTGAALCVEETEVAARARNAIDQLPEHRRVVFVLFELEGQSCEAIAAGLGIKIGTVYSRLHAARRAFCFSMGQAEPSAQRARVASPRGTAA